ncbi:hypothetical protein DFS34DRAFT_647807 [Phlyctochytrium arcticum]|nr:hypothetical protein DFS34DRAFT_647807 [Phlyctochytrium arcticum]
MENEGQNSGTKDIAKTVFGRDDERRNLPRPCCNLGAELEKQPGTSFLPVASVDPGTEITPSITITQTQKNADAGGAYILYLIHVSLPNALNTEAGRRYSEFESMRKLLVKLHPTVVVPPIPEKNSVADYATKPKKAKSDPNFVERRRVLLQSFLNRVGAHPVLRQEHVFHRFLEGNGTWAEILQDSGLESYLHKKDTSLNVSERGSLKRPDPHFVGAEDYTTKFSNEISHTSRVHKLLQKHQADMTSTLADIGASYNGWSLSEGELAHAIEHVGQAIDSTVSASVSVSKFLEGGFVIPLQEYSHYSKAVEKLLKWRHKKHLEYEALSESLIAKQASLQKLEASENEAQRVSAVLNAEGANRAHLQSSGGIMAKLNSLIDNDPALTRRNNISRTRERIITLEEQRATCKDELAVANDEIQQDLDRFQIGKLRDIRNMLLKYASSQKDYHSRVIKAWQEAQTEINKITSD